MTAVTVQALYKSYGFKLPSELIPNCTAKFIAKFQASDCV